MIDLLKSDQWYKIAALLIGVGFIIWAIYFTFSQVPQEIIEKIFTPA